MEHIKQCQGHKVELEALFTLENSLIKHQQSNNPTAHYSAHYDTTTGTYMYIDKYDVVSMELITALDELRYLPRKM